MNKNYRLLSFRSFFIFFFHFYLFSRGLPLAGFFGWGREAKNTVLPESFFYIQIFSLFFYFYTFSLFYIFLHFQIFSLFYIFTIFRFFSSMVFFWITPPPPPPPPPHIFTFLQFFRGHSSSCFFK